MSSSSIKVIVTGASGQLGQEIRHVSHKYQDIEFQFFSKAELDISQLSNVKEKFNAFDPVFCINCAAYTQVDLAETNEDLAYQVNAQGAANIAKVAADHNCQLVHISTEYVYHNGLKRALRETDPTEPKGIYARSKLQGEMNVLSIHPTPIIIRTSWLYSTFGSNFVKTMLRLGLEKKQIKIVADQIGSPTYARDLAEVIVKIIRTVELRNNIEELCGIYNYSNEGQVSWYDFAKEIFKLKGLACTVTPITTSEFNAASARPVWGVMSKEKISQVFQLTVPYWKDSLIRCLQKLNN